MKNMWDERYSKATYVYGEKPNKFFAEQLSNLPKGTIILPCEGEGRNAVFAASLGWEVIAFDSSKAGKAKAMDLATKNRVNLQYDIADALTVQYPKNSADVVAFIYAHFSPAERNDIHKKAISWLKPGGRVIMEAFNPGQLQNASGGPKDVTMLYTIDMIAADFKPLNIDLIEELQTTLHEGKYHEGKADILRFVGTKI